MFLLFCHFLRPSHNFGCLNTKKHHMIEWMMTDLYNKKKSPSTWIPCSALILFFSVPHIYMCVCLCINFFFNFWTRHAIKACAINLIRLPTAINTKKVGIYFLCVFISSLLHFYVVCLFAFCNDPKNNLFRAMPN